MTENTNVRDVWECRECAGEFDRPGIIKHLQEVHKVDTKQPARRSTLMCLDGSDFFSNTYEYEIGGITLTRTIAGSRYAGTR